MLLAGPTDDPAENAHLAQAEAGNGVFILFSHLKNTLHPRERGTPPVRVRTPPTGAEAPPTGRSPSTEARDPAHGRRGPAHRKSLRPWEQRDPAHRNRVSAYPEAETPPTGAESHSREQELRPQGGDFTQRSRASHRGGRPVNPVSDISIPWERYQRRGGSLFDNACPPAQSG